MGTTHSIPVLGFYGNWSDASMFDVGSRMEYLTGEETRAPYLGDMKGNAAVVAYGESSQTAYFGGNPVVPDERYLPAAQRHTARMATKLRSFNLCSSEMLQLLVSPPKT